MDAICAGDVEPFGRCEFAYTPIAYPGDFFGFASSIVFVLQNFRSQFYFSQHLPHAHAPDPAYDGVLCFVVRIILDIGAAQYLDIDVITACHPGRRCLLGSPMCPASCCRDGTGLIRREKPSTKPRRCPDFIWVTGVGLHSIYWGKPFCLEVPRATIIGTKTSTQPQ